MVLRRAYPVLWCVALALGFACSGSSNGGDGGDDDDSAGGASAGEMGSGGSSGKGGKAGSGGASATGGAGGSSNEAGAGNAAAVGGIAGVAGVGATAGTAAIGGISGTAGTGTAGTGPIVPMEWTCAAAAYQNGVCDCGCGAADPDCDNHDEVAACDLCNGFGSCNLKTCPGDIDRSDTRFCRPPPEGWTCSVSAYEDGVSCDCGCGIADPDCESEDVDACDVCDLFGSCAGGNCPSSIDENDNTSCDIPEEWGCDSHDYKDGACHCGCGVLDPDCASQSRSVCDVCSKGCSDEFCPGPIDEADNTICTGPPSSWNCDRAFYRDGAQCHCGCGALDPDCTSDAIEDCERCNFDGSCSARACPGTIDPDDTAHCLRPDPPSEWTCDPYLYADGFQCNCGCGAEDLDCVTASINNCDTCYGCGSNICPGRVDPTDPTQCVPPPEDWTCLDDEYLDGYACHCGCGAPDPDCDTALPSSCAVCSKDNGGCTYDCGELDPMDNSRCMGAAPPQWECHEAYYGDQVCDCGCAVVDVDCASAASSACASCEAIGSCAGGDCGRIVADDNASCVESGG